MPTDPSSQHLFENFGKLPESHAESVNRIPREKLKNWLNIPIGKPGHCLLLKAPRAGHGKTHLLTRLLHELGGSHEFIPLHAVGGSRIDAATILDDTLRRLVRGLPAAGGLTVLDLVARRLFSMALQPLVNSGEVPCQDREAALVALRDRPIETFDFHHPGAVTAHWAKDNFELLGPRLALELSQRNSLSLREVSFWVEALFRFSATQIDNPSRVRTLAAQVFESPSAETVADERLVALLGLLTTLLRVVLVADELEGFSLDEGAALRFASFICALRQSVERVDVIVSVNQDIWDSAFVPRMSAGLTDRLSELTVAIEPLDQKGVVAVIESRFPGEGLRLAAEMRSTYARGIVREATELRNRNDFDEPAIAAYTEPEVPVIVEPLAPVVIAPSAPIEDAPVVESAAYEPPPAPAPAPEVIIPPALADADAFVWPAPDIAAPPTHPVAEDFVPNNPSDVPAVSDAIAFDEASPFQMDTTGESPKPPQAVQELTAGMESPPVQVSPPAPEPVPVVPIVQAAPAPAAETATDRVDDLLRQFRERYGKS